MPTRPSWALSAPQTVELVRSRPPEYCRRGSRGVRRIGVWNRSRGDSAIRGAWSAVVADTVSSFDAVPGSHSPMLSVLAHYPPDCAPRAWTKAASGFSGAEVYRLETARGTLALRRWPAEHPSPERLWWIHTVLTQAVANGFDRLPLPIRPASSTGREKSQTSWPSGVTASRSAE